MKRSELKQLIRETIEEVQGAGPDKMVALKNKKDGYWDIISISAWEKGGMLDLNPDNYDAYYVSNNMYQKPSNPAK
jgi:hypothetical protein